MKKFIAILSIVVFSLALSFNALAQGPGPGDPPSGAGTGDAPIGGNAPIGGGLFILLGMSAAYGGRKLYNLVQEEELEN